MLAITVDGSLADWNGRTSATLTAAQAEYLRPAATPAAANLSSRLWTACSGDYMLIAGIITDTAIYSPGDFPLYVGDSAEVQIDGLADGIVRPGQDDHDVFIGQNSTIKDYGIPMVATVIARTTPSSNWRYEVAIPLSELWGTLGAGSEISTTLSLYDRDTSTPTPPASADRVMVGPSWRWNW